MGRSVCLSVRPVACVDRPVKWERSRKFQPSDITRLSNISRPANPKSAEGGRRHTCEKEIIEGPWKKNEAEEESNSCSHSIAGK